MDPRVAPLAETLRINSRLFRNCLDGMTDAEARERPSDTANSVAFVAAHLAESRFMLLKFLGAEHPNPLERYLGGRKGIEDMKSWPSLEEIRAAWAEAGQLLDRRLAAMSAADLDAPTRLGFPVETRTNLGILAFLVGHDSYHVGQLALLRKQAGFPAMKYT